MEDAIQEEKPFLSLILHPLAINEYRLLSVHDDIFKK